MFTTNEERKAFVAKFKIIDDVFFQKIVEDKSACEEILQVIMNCPDLRVVSVQAQKYLRNIGNKSVNLDALRQVGDEELFNIEMQKADNDDHVKRVRYYSSNLDTISAEKGIDYFELPDLYMVYITKNDFLKGDRCIYHVKRVLEENGQVVYNGINEIYVNAAVNDGSLVAELMAYFKNSTSENGKFPNIAKRVKYYKESNEGVSAVCDIVQALIAEEQKKVQEAIAESREKTKASAIKMYKRGDSAEEIADILSEDIETIKTWLKEVA